MTYQVRLEQFEGPLELLLHLIEKEKLDITRLSLSQVADQYLEYLDRGQAISLANLSLFLSIASRLILLKSRALLPLLTFTEEEEQSIEELEWQLREYRRMREAAHGLGELFRQRDGSFARESFIGQSVVFQPPRHLTSLDLRTAFEEVLGGIPVVESLEEETVATIITLEEKMSHLRDSLAERLTTSFQALTRDVESRVEMIVTFLALLELVKQRSIRVRQETHFSDIHIEHYA